MGTPTIIILVTLLVILATLIPSYRISKKKGVTESEWAIGGRALPLYVVVGTQFASSMGGGILVGAGRQRILQWYWYAIICRSC